MRRFGTERPAMGRMLFLCVAGVVAVARLGGATVFEIGPADNFAAAANALGPGDELQLRGGTYVLSGFVSINVSGSADSPILIHAKANETAVLQGAPNQNVLSVAGSWIVLRDLDLTGGGGNGVRIASTSDFVTVEGCSIHDVPDVGISANLTGAEYLGLRLNGNEIARTGSDGIYLGCNGDTCRVAGAEVTGNYVHDVGALGLGIELKNGSFDNRVADNVINGAGLVCILVGSSLAHGAANRVEGNAVWGCADNAIQVVEHVTVSNNIVLGAAANGISVASLAGVLPGDVAIVHNTVLATGSAAIRVASAIGSVVVANNAVYNPTGSSIQILSAPGTTVTGNVGAGISSGIVGGFDATGNLALDFVNANLSGAPPNDVFPISGSKLVDAGNATFAVTTDFNHTPRSAPHEAGAYQFSGGRNPGWWIKPAFKVVPEPDVAVALLSGALCLAIRRRTATPPSPPSSPPSSRRSSRPRSTSRSHNIAPTA